MTVPPDADDVLAAIRLGWAMAEVRGRNRPDPPGAPGLSMPGRQDHALPLRTERTPDELRIEAQAVLSALAARLGVDAEQGDRWPWRGTFSYPRAVDAAARGLAKLPARRGPAASRAWDSFTGLMYRFDAHIQDVLHAWSDSQACGYQLGRAIAESYWALHPDLPANAPTAGGATQAAPGGAAGGAPGPVAAAGSWQFLLGNERCAEMSRLLGRLSAYLHPYTAASIAGSLRVWNQVAKDGQWRRTAYRDLFPQLRRWYELLVLRQDPTTLIKPYSLARNFRVT